MQEDHTEMNETSLRNLETVAEGLGPLLDQVVFVGGAVVGLYATASAAPQARPTLDVDCIIDIASYSDYKRLGEELRAHGFKNGTAEGAPNCRWVYKGVKVDIMPTSRDVLGFSDPWHSAGIRHPWEVTTPESKQLWLLRPAYFLASKLQAVKDRGWQELKMSHDFEDVVYMVRNRNELFNEVEVADPIVRKFISDTSTELLIRQDIDEAILWMLDSAEPEGTTQRVHELLLAIAHVNSSD